MGRWDSRSHPVGRACTAQGAPSVSASLGQVIQTAAPRERALPQASPGLPVTPPRPWGDLPVLLSGASIETVSLNLYPVMGWSLG